MSYKIKINKSHLKDIEQLKLLVEAHRVAEEQILNRIEQAIGLQTEHQKNVLFDYVYNDSTYMVEVEES